MQGKLDYLEKELKHYMTKAQKLQEQALALLEGTDQMCRSYQKANELALKIA